MSVRRLQATCLFFFIAGCQYLPNSPSRTELSPLTLAEVSRNSDQISRTRCYDSDEGLWSCQSSSPSVKVSQAAPKDIAPFMAQIYLHPEFTTEQDLIDQGAKNRSRWSVRHICGGALIAPNWVATAAHCFPDSSVDTKYGVRLGMNDISADEGYLYKVEKVVRRDPNGRTRDNDIALVKLEERENSPGILSQTQISQIAASSPEVLAVKTNIDEDYRLVLTEDMTFHVFSGRPNKHVSTGIFGEFGFLNDNKTILGTSFSGVYLADISGETETRHIPFPGLISAELFEDNKRIAVYSTEEKKVALIDLRSNQRLEEYDVTMDFEFIDLFLVNNETQLLVWRSASPDLLFDLGTGARQTLKIPPNTDFMGETPDGSALLFRVPSTQYIYKVDTRDGAPIDSKFVGAINKKGVLDDRYFVSHVDNQLNIYNKNSLASEMIIETVSQPEWLFNDDTLFLSHDEGISVFADAGMGDNYTIYTPTNATFRAMSAVPDTSSLLYSVDRPIEGPLNGSVSMTQIYIRDIHSRQNPSIELRVSAEYQSELKISDFTWAQIDKSTLIATSFTSGRSFIWNLEVCETLKSPCLTSLTLDHTVGVSHTEVIEEKNKLVVGARNGTVQVWDLDTGTEDFRIYHGGFVHGSKYDPVTEELLTYGGNGFVRIWDLKTGNEVQRLDFSEFDSLAPQPDYVIQTTDIDPSVPHQDYLAYIKFDQTGEYIQDGQPIRVFGWGRFAQSLAESRSNDLREAGLSILTAASCNEPELWNGHKDVHEGTFCGFDIERKTCPGDSGGPIIHGDGLGNLMLVGIASWGSPKCEADGRPGVFTKVAHHADWINSVINPEALIP